MSQSPLQISCTIITKNEVDRIEPVIVAAWKVSDEVVVIDSGSDDGTVALCEKLGCRVIHNDWVGYGPQKRFGEDQAAFDWQLNVDGDEELSDELIEELRAIKETGAPDCSGYRFRTVNVYPGHTRPRLFADYHNFIRFYDRRTMRFPESLVYDAVIPGDARVGQLDGPCWHYSMRSIPHLIAKLDSYTSLQAKEVRRARWKILLRLPFEYPVQFIKYMIFRRHITGGLFGLKFSHEVSKSKVRRLMKFWNAN